MGFGRVAGATAAVLLAVTAAACSGGGDDKAGLDSAAEDSGGNVATGAPDSAQTAPQEGLNYGEDFPTFEDYGFNPTVTTSEDNQSTFALDVDTGSYTIVRNHLNAGYLPDAAAVRTEEFVNYFPQDYAVPEDGIGIHLDGTAVPFLDGPDRRVVRVGLQAAEVEAGSREAAVLTFVVDTSGSMADAGKLDLVRDALGRLVESLRPEDRVGIVTYSDTAEVRLEPTPVSEAGTIQDVIGGLQPLQSTNAEAGLRLGYEQAQANFREGGINRVILLSDGVANTGETDPIVLADEIQAAAGDGIQLVTVGVGMGTYSDVVMEQLADRGDGFYAYVDSLREAERLFVDDLTGTLAVVAREAKVQVTFDPNAVTSYRLLGFENRQVADEALQDDSVDGGEIGSGHTVTALYEVTLPEGAAPAPGAALATVDVHWLDPDSAQPVDRSATLFAGDMAAAFDEAPPRLRQDILVAALAESLRAGPWSASASRTNVADNAQALRSVLPDDTTVAEFATLARTAADLG